MTARDAELHGCWRLVSFDTERQGSSERRQPWGADPNGFAVFTPDGRMTVLVAARTREPGDTDEKMAALLRTMVSYTGRYRVGEGKFVTRIDASWNEAWNGTEQERYYAIAGDTLEVSTAWMPNPLAPGHPLGRGVLVFVRE